MEYEEWTSTVVGALALSLAQRADTFKEASAALKAAYEAGQQNAPKEPKV